MKFLSATAIAALMLGTPAAFAQTQDGLVNVSVDDNVVQVPVAVAANACGIDVAALSEFVGSDDTACSIDQKTAAQNGIKAAKNNAGNDPKMKQGKNDSSSADQTGLVNVSVDDNVVQVPVGVAANACGVDVSALSGFLGSDETACSIDQSTAAQNGIKAAKNNAGNDPKIKQGSDGGDQSGLVNVSVDDNVVQVPISVAANVCDLDISALSEFVGSDDTACTIDQETAAANGID
ncbi:hypothetical protein [Brevirhabdus sp.]|uniref:hypothetical protein n=1 Tax=Brevirhabdus sp. TaxID=2004514 RepID=UPI0040586EA7